LENQIKPPQKPKKSDKPVSETKESDSTSKRHTYLYPFIQKVVKRLEQKGLVSTRKDTSGARNKRIVSPTFKGIIYFLQNQKPTSFVLDELFKNHESIMPFSSKPEFLEGSIAWNAFMETVWEFYCIRRAKFSIKHLNLTFEAYLEANKRINERRLQYMNPSFHQNLEVLSALEKNEMSELKNAYIACLALGDIELLSYATKGVKVFAPILISEREMAHFEKREIGINSIFEGERLKDLFPKYSSLQSLFLGMFVRNLLWGPLAGSGAKNSEVSDYEVKEIL
jgi:hypothetical protein